MKVIKNGVRLRGGKGTVVTLGNFDGIHLGHQLILKKVRERASSEKLLPVVYTFEPHPLKVVSPSRCPQLILDVEDKIGLIKALGIGRVVLARFTMAFASRHPREFVEEELVRCLRPKEVWVGSNFSFGRGKSGTVEYLKALGREYGFRVWAVAPYRKGGEVVSSSRVRELVKNGEVKKAASLLGRDYSVKGRVVKGASLGKELGFPTANLRVKSELVPRNGVYAALAFIGRKTCNAVVNIGVAPTFGKRPRTVEAHIIGFKADIYGKTVRLAFLKRLRDEVAFSNREALVRQIGMDVKKASRIFEKTGRPTGTPARPRRVD